MQRTSKEIVRHLITRTGMAALHARIRKASGKNVAHLFADSLPERFRAIYQNRVWLEDRQSGSLSGGGSEIGNTSSVRQQLPDLLETINSRRLLDAGCGDFNWMKEVQLKCQYIGTDIVPDLIAAHSSAYSSDKRRFLTLDITRDSLPEADTVLCREVLFHLSFSDIWHVIRNIRDSGASWLIATNDTTLTFNADILSGDYRMLNLHRAPFCLPPPRISIPDDSLAPGRVLAVWNVADLPKSKSRRSVTRRER